MDCYMTSLFVQQKQRLEWVDYMKVLGMFLIIYGHIYPRLYISQTISAFFVQVFFVLSGFLCTKSYGFRELFGHLKSTITLYFVLTISTLFLCHFLWNERFSLCQYLNGILLGNVDIIHNMWFVYTLIVIRIIHNYLIRFKTLPLIAVGFCLLTLIIGGQSIRLPFALIDVVISLPFFELGYFLSKNCKDNVEKNIEHIQQHLGFYIIISAVLYASIWFSVHLNGYVNMYKSDYGNSFLLFIINSIIGIYATFIVSILIYRLFNRQKNFFKVMAYGNIFTLAFHLFLVKWAQQLIWTFCPSHFRYIIPAEIVASIIILLMFTPFNYLYYNFKHKRVKEPQPDRI